MADKIWKVLSKSKDKKIIDILLENRGLKTLKEKKEFLSPPHPDKLSLKSVEIKEAAIKKAIVRIKKALKTKEKVIVYGDYDADGICATAILWETLHAGGVNCLPFIPDRFNDGYGLSTKSIEKLKDQNPDLKLIITVDNGIVANEAVETAKKLGIDVIITDHHQVGKKLPKAYSIIHTTVIGGAGISWIFAREVRYALKLNSSKLPNGEGIELAGIGTVADQLPLIGPNRSLAKYGIEYLNKTVRCGLLSLFEDAGIKKGEIGTYEINFAIAPRINAVGRLGNALESLRLICTKDSRKGQDLAKTISKMNFDRQKLVDETLLHARDAHKNDPNKKIIVLHHESYHEGIIGLAASRLVEEFYRPAIVISTKGEIAKASARSVSGFNIIETVRQLDYLWEEGGGHPMAAGFSIKTEKIEEFKLKLEEISDALLTDEVLTRKLKIDLEVQFKDLDWDLAKALSSFEPTGIGNPTPLFVTKDVKILDLKTVGSDKKHLKLKLAHKDKVFDAIAFGFGPMYSKLSDKPNVDAVYVLEENVWNGSRSLQLRIKDIKQIS